MAASGAIEPFDHFDPAFMIDPYPGYAVLRERCPVHHSDKHGGFYVLSTFHDVYEAAQDTALFSSEGDAVAIPPNHAQGSSPLARGARICRPR